MGRRLQRQIDLVGIFAVAMTLGFAPGRTFAACASPTAQAGALENFAGTYKVCNGANWNTISMSSTSLGGCTSAQTHAREYDPDWKAVKICDGSQFKAVNCTTGSGGSNFNYCMRSQQLGVIAPDGATNDLFGGITALSNDGSTAVVAASNKQIGSNANQGAVYIFVRSGSGWAQQARLTASDGAANDYFGGNVAVSRDGNTIVVGAHNATVSFSNQGVAYVFVRSGSSWTQQAKLVASDPSATASFGGAVGLSGDGNTAVIGAYKKSSNTGGAYVFVRSGTSWSQQANFVASDTTASDRFGYVVALSGDGNTALITANWKTVGANSLQGAAYIFTRSGSAWSERIRLTASDGAASDGFGNAGTLSYDGTTALVGASGHKVGSNFSQGAAYVYTGSGASWTEQAILSVSDGRGGDNLTYGNGVALSGDGSVAMVATMYANSSQGKAYLFTRSGTIWTERKQITATDAAGNDRLGVALSLSGDGTQALVGAYNKAIGATTGQGKVYFISGWPLTSVSASDGVGGDWFGISLAVASDGNTAIIGAQFKTVGANSGQGAAYIFIRSGSTWLQQGNKLTASDGAANDYFGGDVAISSDGNTVAIGATETTVAGNAKQGSVYIFTRSGTTWSQQAKLTASDGVAYDTFGASVALSSDGNSLLIGAPVKTIGGNLGQGTVYFFTRSGSTWTEQGTKLTSSDGTASDQFGYAVSISSDGKTAAITANSKNSGAGANQGALYIFTRSGSTWSQQGNKLTVSDPAAGDYFGHSVSISSDGSVAAIGAFQKTVSGFANHGAVYIFTRSGSTWNQQTKLTQSGGAANDKFGSSVALFNSGNAVLVGAAGKTVGANSGQGAAYVFTRSGANWYQLTQLTAYDGSNSDAFGQSTGVSSTGVGFVGASGKNAAYPYALNFPMTCTQTPPVSQFIASGGNYAIKSPGTTTFTAISNLTLSAGDTLLVCAASQATVSALNWNGTNLTQDDYSPASNANAYIYSLPNATAGTGNLTITISASGNPTAVSTLVVKGLTSAPFDKSGANTGSSTAPSSTLSASTTQADELLYSCVNINGPSDDLAGAWTAPLTGNGRTGTTGSGATSNTTVNDGYGILTATGTYSGEITGIRSRAWSSVTATYKITIPSSCQTYGSCSAQGGLNYSTTNSAYQYCDGLNWRQIQAP